MSKLKLITSYSFLLISVSLGQSSNPKDFYPYHKGDIRLYRSEFTGTVIYTQYTDSVIADTVTKDILLYHRYISDMTDFRKDRIDSLGNLFNMSYQSEYVRYKLYADSGDSWQAGVINDTVPVIATVVYIYNTILYGTLSKVKAIRFQYQNSPPPNSPFTIGTDHLAEGFGLVEAEVEPSDVYVLTGAVIGGIHYGEPILRVEEKESSISQFSLSQNYPNPFNPTTTISFALPGPNHVSLVIYDCLGRTVETLVNQQETGGYHHVLFNATELSSGIYYYRITIGSYSSIKKMSLIK